MPPPASLWEMACQQHAAALAVRRDALPDWPWHRPGATLKRCGNATNTPVRTIYERRDTMKIWAPGHLVHEWIVLSNQRVNGRNRAYIRTGWLPADYSFGQSCRRTGKEEDIIGIDFGRRAFLQEGFSWMALPVAQ